MFSTFTFKFLAPCMLVAAVAIGAASPAEAGKKNKPDVPGHWERSQDGGFEWVGKKKLKPKAVEPVVRDHRNNAGGGGVTVADTTDVRDHRAKPQIRDHRAGSEADDNHQPAARDTSKKKKKIIGVQWPF